MRLVYGLFLLAALRCAAAARQETPTAPPPRLHATSDHAREVNGRYVKQLLERIAGREQDPARNVFKNIQLPWFKNVPAGVFIDIMNEGYSRALGVACTHCHNVEDFAGDEKREKRAAREMAIMHKMINEQLAKMQNVQGKPDERFINCATCHRGEIDPRLKRNE
jgi:Photosynthetic reaction centre cytochrome C subunit